MNLDVIFTSVSVRHLASGIWHLPNFLFPYNAVLTVGYRNLGTVQMFLFPGLKYHDDLVE
jgi:hypothetical protein